MKMALEYMKLLTSKSAVKPGLGNQSHDAGQNRSLKAGGPLGKGMLIIQHCLYMH